MSPSPLKKLARNDKEWHYLVCLGADYVCEVCQHDFNYPCHFDMTNTNQMVCGHHRQGKKAHPTLRFVVSNGVCVCRDCHAKIHNGQIKLNN